MSEFKYEPIFGDQSLFYGAPEDAVSVRYGKSEYIFDSEEIKATTGQLRDVPVVAMRRIIKTPVWTVADQKAGLLPEKGAKYEVDGCVVTHLGNGAAGYQNIFYFEYPSGACGNAHERMAKPIETPEEKAQRERNEWAKKASQFIDDELDCVNIVGEHVMRRFYNALKSGELPMPKKEDE